MDNKKVGLLIMGIAVLMIIIVFIFNNALHEIVDSSCSLAGHGDSCPMYNTVKTQTNLSLAIIGLVFFIAVFLIFSKPQKVIVEKIVEKEKPPKLYDISDLKPEEKTVFKLIKENKTIFQSDLIDKTDFGKAKMTRILDKLEGKNFVERKRRGMTNVVVLKE